MKSFLHEKLIYLQEGKYHDMLISSHSHIGSCLHLQNSERCTYITQHLLFNSLISSDVRKTQTRRDHLGFDMFNKVDCLKSHLSEPLMIMFYKLQSVVLGLFGGFSISHAGLI